MFPCIMNPPGERCCCGCFLLGAIIVILIIPFLIIIYFVASEPIGKSRIFTPTDAPTDNLVKMKISESTYAFTIRFNVEAKDLTSNNIIFSTGTIIPLTASPTPSHTSITGLTTTTTPTTTLPTPINIPTTTTIITTATITTTPTPSIPTRITATIASETATIAAETAIIATDTTTISSTTLTTTSTTHPTTIKPKRFLYVRLENLVDNTACKATEDINKAQKWQFHKQSNGKYMIVSDDKPNLYMARWEHISQCEGDDRTVFVYPDMEPRYDNQFEIDTETGHITMCSGEVQLYINETGYLKAKAAKKASEEPNSVFNIDFNSGLIMIPVDPEFILTIASTTKTPTITSPTTTPPTPTNINTTIKTTTPTVITTITTSTTTPSTTKPKRLLYLTVKDLVDDSACRATEDINKAHKWQFHKQSNGKYMIVSDDKPNMYMARWEDISQCEGDDRTVFVYPDMKPRKDNEFEIDTETGHITICNGAVQLYINQTGCLKGKAAKKASKESNSVFNVDFNSGLIMIPVDPEFILTIASTTKTPTITSSTTTPPTPTSIHTTIKTTTTPTVITTITTSTNTPSTTKPKRLLYLTVKDLVDDSACRATEDINKAHKWQFHKQSNGKYMIVSDDKPNMYMARWEDISQCEGDDRTVFVYPDMQPRKDNEFEIDTETGHITICNGAVQLYINKTGCLKGKAAKKASKEPNSVFNVDFNSGLIMIPVDPGFILTISSTSGTPKLTSTTTTPPPTSILATTTTTTTSATNKPTVSTTIPTTTSTKPKELLYLRSIDSEQNICLGVRDRKKAQKWQFQKQLDGKYMIARDDKPNLYMARWSSLSQCEDNDRSVFLYENMLPRFDNQFEIDTKTGHITICKGKVQLYINQTKYLKGKTRRKASKEPYNVFDVDFNSGLIMIPVDPEFVTTATATISTSTISPNLKTIKKFLYLRLENLVDKIPIIADRNRDKAQKWQFHKQSKGKYFTIVTDNKPNLYMCRWTERSQCEGDDRSVFMYPDMKPQYDNQFAIDDKTGHITMCNGTVMLYINQKKYLKGRSRKKAKKERYSVFNVDFNSGLIMIPVDPAFAN